MTRLLRKDRASTIAAVAFVLALLSWYLGASAAIDRIIDTSGLLIAACVIGAAAGAASLGFERSFGSAAFAFASAGFLAFNALALIDVHADGSSARAERALFVDHYAPNKGPEMSRFMWQTREVSLQAKHARACTANTEVVLELRAGALGAAWIERVRCD